MASHCPLQQRVLDWVSPFSGPRSRITDSSSFRDRYSFRFLGVRYAPQPVRFTYSAPYSGNGSQVSALEYGSQCVQGGNVGSEDCLFLNIWTNLLPGSKSSRNPLKPVMVRYPDVPGPIPKPH